MENKREVWLRGNKTNGLSPLLQPVADALLQAREEIENALQNFPDNLLWEKPAGCASVGFHLKHIAGFLDRLLTYAEAKQLSQEQFSYLKSEETVDESTTIFLVNMVTLRIEQTIERLKNLPENILTEKRGVGRAALPSTVIGLCIHAAEHTMRHTGQLIVMVKILAEQFK
ncbi:metal-dependent hydrolase [Arachidicoccus ginsenosidimutans]|uniref:DinB family protein n=1 Tax=Arachidicoccus sp. BS20 TaxID=1850526 RepID=UPI0007F06402|nr:DinB family protein [Arachidicoccus sp. BS20]ANI87990.1 metal-dependent hydrolase [Arachidicoccus sp. BS20]